MLNKKGFTMVELLVVLVIVGILAAVATPIYLANVQRSRASEAISTMGLIRQAERDYRINHNIYFDVAAATDVGKIQLPLPATTAITAGTGAVTGNFGLDVNVGVSQYFSNGSFTVESNGDGSAALPDTDGASGLFAGPPAVDFIVSASGLASSVISPFGQNNVCAAGDPVTVSCSAKGAEVTGYRLEMDNSGRIFVSYDNAITWSAY